MQEQILEELKQIKSALTKLMGTQNLPAEQQFSMDAINNAAIQFQKISSERGEWVKEYDIRKYIKADWRAAKFIRTEFGFNACIKDGRSYLFNKKALQQLAQELKKRNIDLQRYMEYQLSEAEFKKKLAENKKSVKRKRPFVLPANLKNITTSSPPMPDVQLVKNELKQLKEDFFHHKMSEYIDIYRGNYAMTKFIYPIEKYVESDIKRRCKKWCDDFNYANHALELITKKKEIFIPVKEEEMIQL